MGIALRYAARSDVGLVRSNNQDSGYAGPHLLVIADGMGGHAGGDIASSLAIGELAPLDEESHGSDALGHLASAVYDAHRELLHRVSQEPQLSGMGTTITALLRSGSRFALAHIGDSRAYLLREDRLVQITRDHTFVQRLVDDGKLTPEQAEQHPQRSVLMRVLSDVVEDVEPDMSMREARIGDRYLLCSDGLSAVVSFDTLQQTLAARSDPAATCETLVQLALRGGAPDNVTCIVADVVDSATPTDTVPIVVGSASTRRQVRSTPPASAAERAAELTAGSSEAAGDEDEDPSPPAGSPRRLKLIAAVVALLVVLAGGGYGAYRWSRLQFFVGSDSGSVAIFRGLPQTVGPVKLSGVDRVAADVQVSDLPPYFRRLVQKGIVADDETSAEGIVQRLREQAAACRAARRQLAPGSGGTASPPAAGTTAGSAKPSPRPGASLPATRAATPTPRVTLPTPSGSAGTGDDCTGLG